MARLHALGVLALLAAGCAAPATGLVVVVDSDLEAGSEISTLDVAVSGPGATASRRIDVATAGTLPLSFGAAPTDGRSATDVRVQIVALGPDGEPRTRWQAHTRYVTGRVLRLDARLARSCAESACEEHDQVCDDGACRGIELDPSALPEADPSARPIALTFTDAGMPPSEDAAACVPDQPCATTNPCAVGVTRCQPAECVQSALLAAGESCGEGRACSASGECR